MISARQLLFVLTGVLLAACDSTPPGPVPSELVELAYIGSESCRSCHDDEFRSWESSHHAQAMQIATPATVLGDFSDAEFRYFDTVSTFSSLDGNFHVRTENASGELQDFRISHTFGVAPLQQYLVELPGGRLQPLPIAWDDRSAAEGGQRWFHLYPDEFIDVDDELHWTGRTQNWNYMCAECHSTDLQKNYNLESDAYATTWSEINVGCEGCHGPASRHVQQAQIGFPSGGTALIANLDDSGRSVWQMNTHTGIAERTELRMRPPVQPEVCGRCHARRSILTENYAFDPSLLATHLPSLLDQDLYFPDGQIKDEVYVYGSFLQSRMYQSGVSCGDCHDPHSASLRSGAVPSDICSTCHLPERFATAAHHNHQPEDVACVDCHMPASTYMGVDDRRDHSFRIPRPDLTIATGSPNACQSCHTDRDAVWSLSAIDRWYGTDRPPHIGTAIHAAQTGAMHANSELAKAIRDELNPGISRGTALSLLRGPYSQEIAEVIRDSLQSPDPFMRIGALRALPSLQPELRVAWGGPLLADPLRAVRVEAVKVISPVRGELHMQYDTAYKAADIELVNSLHAIAERPEAHLNLGNHRIESGDLAAAEVEFRTALRLDPASVAARVNLVDLYRQLGREEAAEQLLREGLARYPDDAALRHSLGLLMVRGDQRDLALTELAAAATLQPDNPRYVYVYGVALNSLGNSELAIDVLADAANRFPADFDIRWGLITLLRDVGRRDEARELAEEMLARYPGVASIQNLLQSI